MDSHECFPCDFCDKTFSKRYYMYKHCRRVHRIEPQTKKTLKCPIDDCENYCQNYDELRRLPGTMPYKCCIPWCRGNYNADNKVAVFSFPKEEEAGKKWLDAIPRENYVITKNSRVCELHFTPLDIERETHFHDNQTGHDISIPLMFPRLHSGAIPSKFSLSRPKVTTSTKKEKRGLQHKQKRVKIEAQQKVIEEQENTIVNANTEFDLSVVKVEVNSDDECDDPLRQFPTERFYLLPTAPPICQTILAQQRSKSNTTNHDNAADKNQEDTNELTEKGLEDVKESTDENLADTNESTNENVLDTNESLDDIKESTDDFFEKRISPASYDSFHCRGH